MNFFFKTLDNCSVGTYLYLGITKKGSLKTTRNTFVHQRSEKTIMNGFRMTFPKHMDQSNFGLNLKF